MSGISTRAASRTTGARARTHAFMGGRRKGTIRVAAHVGRALACARLPA
ncbi:MAG: hypothetical protein J0L88_13415 [Xanthomonadales bacterium]|nr:hypothetical protein [Xanthomonadales bacterium]